MEDANKIGMMRKMTRKDGYGKRREGSCGKFIECELWSPSDSRNWLRFEFEMEDWDSQCGGAQFRYDTIRLPSPHPGKVNATTARYTYFGLENMILILEKSMSKLYLLSMWLWKEGSLRAKRSKLALKNRNDRIFLIFFVSLSTPTGLLAQQAWFFLTPFWCHWGTKSRTNGLQQNSSTFNPFVCFSDRTISSFNFFVCFSDRTIIRGWRAGVGALYMVRWSTEGQANGAQVCF